VAENRRGQAPEWSGKKERKKKKTKTLSAEVIEPDAAEGQSGQGPEWPRAKTEATLSKPWQPSADATTDQSSQALQRPSIRATERLSSPTPEARLRPASKCNELEQNDGRDQATTELIQQQKSAEARHETISQATNETINQLM
jgi:hypothetical protein